MNMRYYITLGIIKFISHIPFRLLYALSDALYFPFYYMARYRRKIVRKNLTESFPNKTISEVKTIEKDFYRHFLDMLLESCKLMSISADEMRKRMKFVNIELLEEMLSRGQSISAFLGHHGNWEWISSSGLWFRDQGTVVQIYHQLHNQAMNRIITKMRTRMGNACVNMNSTVKYMIQATSNDEPHIYGLIADQSPRKNESKHYTTFLNHRVPVVTGPEKATKHFGFAAVYISVKKCKRGYYECIISPLHDNVQTLPDYELTTLYYQRLENDILQQPELYLWTHNRFKYAHQNCNI